MIYNGLISDMLPLRLLCNDLHQFTTMCRVSAKVWYEKRAVGQDEVDFENCTQSPALALGCSILHPGAPTTSGPAYELKVSKHGRYQKRIRRKRRLDLSGLQARILGSSSHPRAVESRPRCSHFIPHFRSLQHQTTLPVLQMPKLRDDLWQAHNLVVIPTLLHSSGGRRISHLGFALPDVLVINPDRIACST